MKYLIALALLLCLIDAPFYRTQAKQYNWVEVFAEAEYFRVSMPHQPKMETATTSYGRMDVNGTRYEASADGAGYVLWALVNAKFNAFQATDPDLYLDECADLTWEALLKQARDNLPEDRRARAAMTYVKELPAKPLPGREYSVTVGDVRGTIQFYAAQTRIYVLMAVNNPGGVGTREKFLSSFTVSSDLPMQHPNYGDPKSSGLNTTTAATDVSPILRSSEVTQRARVLEKPEPTYTEAARKYSITGTVILRAVFSKNGEVTNIHIIRKLPHGLTQQAYQAARLIKFTPALKDGQSVSMWMQLEYNFNLY